MRLNSDLREFAALLNAREVDYVIVGAHAVAYHAVPRFTGDLDILVRPSNDNAEKLVGVIDEFGFASLDLAVSDFVEEDTVVQLGVAPNRIDILTSLTGVSFDAIWSNKISVQIEDITVNMIGKAELIANKQALGREQDIADLKLLEG